MIFSTFAYNLTRAPFNLKLSPNCWQPSWGENVVMWCGQSSEDAGPLSFDSWREQAGSAGPCALKFSVMTLPRCSVEFLCSLELTQHIYSWWFLLPFVSSQGAKKLCVEGYKLNCPFPSLSFYFWACVPAAEPVLNSVLSVFQELHDRNAQNHSSVLRYFIPALNLSMRHSWVLGLNTYLIKVWGGIRRNN